MTETITRQYLSDLVYKELGISKVEASRFIDDIFEFITLQLEKKNKVKIANFGSFNIRHKNERIGRNPRTKEQKVISSRTVVTFKPSKILKNKINKMINIQNISKVYKTEDVQTNALNNVSLSIKEGEFVETLQKTTTYSIENLRLTLSNPDGKLLVFRKVD